MARVEDPTKNNTPKIAIAGIAAIVVILIVALSIYLVRDAENREVWDMSASVPDDLTVEYVDDDSLGHYVSFATVEEPTHIMDIFEDPSCPHCGEFSREHGDTTNDKVASGELELNSHIMNFMDESSGATYSDDAGGVLVELAKNGDAVNAWRVYNGIWDNQPQAGTPIDSVPSMDDMISALRSSEDPVDEAVFTALEEGESGQRILDSTVTNTDVLIETTNRVSTPTLFFDNEEHQFEIGDDQYFDGLFDN